MCCKKCKKGLCVTDIVAKILVIIGGINWGLVGLGMLLNKTDWNVVHLILSSVPKIEAIVYLIVGVSAIVLIFGCKCRKCQSCCVSGEEKKEEIKM